MRVYMHVCTRVCVCMYIHIRMHVCKYIHVRMYRYLGAHVHVRMFSDKTDKLIHCDSARMYVCV